MYSSLCILWISSLLAGAESDVVQAQRFYEQARYEDALEALGTSCQSSANEVECERLRAFVYVALGQENEARSAFARLLAVDPNFALSANVSPKLRGVFEDAKRMSQRLSGLVLEPVELSSERQPWMLRVRTPTGAGIEAITVYVAPQGSEAFTPVALRWEGDMWIGQFRPASGGLGKARYFIESTLSGGITVTAASAAIPKQANVYVGDGPVDEPVDGGEVKKGNGDGLPNWAWWSIIGGGVAVLATSVTLAIVLSQDEGPGRVVVQPVFSGEQ